MVEFSDLIGKIFSSVTADGNKKITFKNEEEEYCLHHHRDCCESVSIEDICGDLEDLVGTPIVVAEEVFGQTAQPEGWTPDKYSESYTWTFYKLRTHKGDVTIRWYGESNGYYSESVDFEKIK